MKFRNLIDDRDHFGVDCQYLSDACFSIDIGEEIKGVKSSFLRYILCFFPSMGNDFSAEYSLDYELDPVNMFAESVIKNCQVTRKTLEKYIKVLVKKEIFIHNNFVSKDEDYYSFNPKIYEKAKELKEIARKKFEKTST